MAIDPEMNFEVAMRQWFGDKAWGTAGLAYSTSACNKWIRKWIVALSKEVEQLDTDPRHKERILRLLDDLETSFLASKDAEWSQVFSFLELVGVLFGRLNVPARKCEATSIACIFQAVDRSFDNDAFNKAIQMVE